MIDEKLLLDVIESISADAEATAEAAKKAAAAAEAAKSEAEKITSNVYQERAYASAAARAASDAAAAAKEAKEAAAKVVEVIENNNLSVIAGWEARQEVAAFIAGDVNEKIQSIKDASTKLESAQKAVRWTVFAACFAVMVVMGIACGAMAYMSAIALTDELQKFVNIFAAIGLVATALVFIVILIALNVRRR